ncbi:MAG: hypothetical protein D4R84_02885 [Rhodocyclaceae bacterium]|nr:MAG: hypothetical protein D4R84_02885 [Rhodocyclaceae bacterium]
MPGSPQNLIDGGIAELKRFGYAPFGDAAPDWAGMWLLLRGDFATLRRTHVPTYAEMSPWPQEGARIYMRRRLLADRLFEECQVLYRRLHGEGINTELVEAYSLARDAYEEAVLDFGKAREMLEDVFTSTVDLVSASRA